MVLIITRDELRYRMSAGLDTTVIWAEDGAPEPRRGITGQVVDYDDLRFSYVVFVSEAYMGGAVK